MTPLRFFFSHSHQVGGLVFNFWRQQVVLINVWEARWICSLWNLILVNHFFFWEGCFALPRLASRSSRVEDIDVLWGAEKVLMGSGVFHLSHSSTARFFFLLLFVVVISFVSQYKSSVTVLPRIESGLMFLFSELFFMSITPNLRKLFSSFLECLEHTRRTMNAQIAENLSCHA